MSDEAIGESIGQRYRLLEIIGTGGLGTVYKALDTRLQRLVALKILRFAHNPKVRQLFLREAKQLARLRHPNIVQIFDVGETDRFVYLALEYIDAHSLEQIMVKARSVDPDNGIEIIRQVGMALSYAHQCGVIHRDIKPSNILISREGRVLLSDFGLAIAPGAPTLSRTGTIAGTPAYMSLEQAMGKPVDARSDIFSLGVLLCELLTGMRPFGDRSTGEVPPKSPGEATVPLPEINSSVPPALKKIVMRSLAKQPEQRFQTVDELLSALAEAKPRQHPQNLIPTVQGFDFERITTEGPRSVDQKLHTLEGESLSGPVASVSGFDGFRAQSSSPRTLRTKGFQLTEHAREAHAAAAELPSSAAKRSRVPAAEGLRSKLLALGTVTALLLLGYVLIFEETLSAPPGHRESAAHTSSHNQPIPESPPARWLGQHGLVLLMATVGTGLALWYMWRSYTNRPALQPAIGARISTSSPTTELAPHLPVHDDSTLGPMHYPSAIAWLLVLDGAYRGWEFRLADSVTIGREVDSDIAIADPRVSRRHARISLENARFYISDLRSRNGTFVNNVQVQKHELCDRDEVKLGGLPLLFIQALSPENLTADAKGRLQEFDAIWDQLTSSARRD